MGKQNWLAKRSFALLFLHSSWPFIFVVMSAHVSALPHDIDRLRSSFTDLLTSGQHYRTPELTHHIHYIASALGSVKLDYEFQRGSTTWSKQFDADALRSNDMGNSQRCLPPLAANQMDLVQMFDVLSSRGISLPAS